GIAGAGGAGSFLARGGLKGLATRLLPKVVRFGGPLAAAGTAADVLGNPAVAGISNAPNLKKLAADAVAGAPGVLGMVKAIDKLAAAQDNLANEASPKVAQAMRENA